MQHDETKTEHQDVLVDMPQDMPLDVTPLSQVEYTPQTPLSPMSPEQPDTQPLTPNAYVHQQSYITVQEHVPTVVSEMKFNTIYGEEDRQAALLVLAMFYLGFFMPPLWIVGYYLGYEKGEHCRRIAEWCLNFFKSCLFLGCCISVVAVIIFIIIFFVERYSK
jgi:uncharacterized membrane protein